MQLQIGDRMFLLHHFPKLLQIPVTLCKDINKKKLYTETKDTTIVILDKNETSRLRKVHNFNLYARGISRFRTFVVKK